MNKQRALVITHDHLDLINAKTCHGLLRFSDRYEVVAVVDRKFVGLDAGEVMDGKKLNVPIIASIQSYFDGGGRDIDAVVIGVATHGGRLPDDFVPEITAGISNGCHIVNGLHDYLSDRPAIAKFAKDNHVTITDIRKPKTIDELHFWDGDIYGVRAKILAVLGVDCALGKRTTSGMIYEMCNRKGLSTEMIYTGQTGWMQGYKHGFIFDSTLNDFISGEIEHAIVQCDRDERPDLILLEGQSALRNPSGPGGSEFLVSGNAKATILQIAPEREYFDGYEDLHAYLPSVTDEIDLIQKYGSDVLAITVYNQSMPLDQLREYTERLEQDLQMPVIIPLEDGVDELFGVIDRYARAN